MSSQNATADGDDPLIGQVVQGRFEVQQRLAAGGMGVVYRAIQQPLGRPVAFKILELSTGPMDASFQQRFFLEASAAAKLAHPNTIVVHDYGRTDAGQYFIAMEYLDGGTLGDRLKDHGPLPPREAVHVGMQIVSSLRDAHQQGLVHRDLKPGNVMFAPRGGDPLFVKVLDFGLVKVVGEGQENLGLTQSGVMMGSPRYMAPEQVKAQPVDARTDIYSFGAVLYHMLAGAPPFSAGSAFEAMNHHVYSAPPPLEHTWGACPASEALEAIVMRCLAKEPAHRFASMGEVLDALRSVAQQEQGALSSSYLMPPSGHFPLASSGGTDSSPALSRSGVSAARSAPAPSASSHRTMRFEGKAAPTAGPAPVDAPASSAVRVPPRSGGFLKAMLVSFLFVVLAGTVGASAFFLPPLFRPPVSPEPSPEAARPPVATPTPVAAPAPTPAPVAAPVAAPAPPPATPPLLLRSDPDGATVRRDGQDLGDTPLSLLIPAGERWEIEVEKRGYEPRRVSVAGGQRELLLHLAALRGGARPARPIPAPMPQPMQPQVRPLVTQPRPMAPARRPARPAYAPDLDDPWAGRR